MNTAATSLHEAEGLKASITETPYKSTEAWIARQKLQDLYSNMLLMDLEYALDKKVEQDLWNHAFKNQINTLQAQSKDKMNIKRNEILASLNLFLETASGFYFQLLQELCSAFNLDLAFRKRASRLGMLKESHPKYSKAKEPKRSSCHYICQHCLVHLGDIARYRQQISQAEYFYTQAARLVPFNGQPYNQLAILEAARGNKLSTVYFYVRSIAVKHPFPVASTNLEKFYAKISSTSVEFKGKLTVDDFFFCFLKLNALIHLSSDFTKAQLLLERIQKSLPLHLNNSNLTSFQLVQMIAIALFSLHYIEHGSSSKTNKNSAAMSRPSSQVTLSKDEQLGHDLLLNLIVSFFEQLLTPKTEKIRDNLTLSPLKVILDWITSDERILSETAFTSKKIWPNLCQLLNNLQILDGEEFNPEQYSTVPLQDDIDLQCFLPMENANLELDYMTTDGSRLCSSTVYRIHCHRLVQRALWICENYPNLMRFQVLRSGKLQFFVGATSMETQLTRKSSLTGVKGSMEAEVKEVEAKDLHGPTKKAPMITPKSIMQRKPRQNAAMRPISSSTDDNASKQDMITKDRSRNNSMSSTSGEVAVERRHSVGDNKIKEKKDGKHLTNQMAGRKMPPQTLGVIPGAGNQGMKLSYNRQPKQHFIEDTFNDPAIQEIGYITAPPKPNVIGYQVANGQNQFSSIIVPDVTSPVMEPPTPGGVPINMLPFSSPPPREMDGLAFEEDFSNMPHDLREALHSGPKIAEMNSEGNDYDILGESSTSILLDTSMLRQSQDASGLQSLLAKSPSLPIGDSKNQADTQLPLSELAVGKWIDTKSSTSQSLFSSPDDNIAKYEQPGNQGNYYDIFSPHAMEFDLFRSESAETSPLDSNRSSLQSTPVHTPNLNSPSLSSPGDNAVLAALGSISCTPEVGSLPSRPTSALGLQDLYSSEFDNASGLPSTCNAGIIGSIGGRQAKERHDSGSKQQMHVTQAPRQTQQQAQGIWTSGPSALEQLLMKQKVQHGHLDGT